MDRLISFQRKVAAVFLFKLFKTLCVNHVSMDSNRWWCRLKIVFSFFKATTMHVFCRKFVILNLRICLQY